MDQQDELLDTPEAAAVLKLQPNTLEVWRTTRRNGLPFIKVGRSVRYRRSDLEAFLAKHTVAA